MAKKKKAPGREPKKKKKIPVREPNRGRKKSRIEDPDLDSTNSQRAPGQRKKKIINPAKKKKITRF